MRVAFTSRPTAWWRMLTSKTCSISSLSGIRAGVTQAASSTSVSVSFMSFLLELMYSSSSWPLMDAMLGSLSLRERRANEWKKQKNKSGWNDFWFKVSVCCCFLMRAWHYLFTRPLTFFFSFSSSALRLSSLTIRRWGGTYFPAAELTYMLKVAIRFLTLTWHSKKKKKKEHQWYTHL